MLRHDQVDRGLIDALEPRSEVLGPSIGTRWKFGKLPAFRGRRDDPFLEYDYDCDYDNE